MRYLSGNLMGSSDLSSMGTRDQGNSRRVNIQQSAFTN